MINLSIPKERHKILLEKSGYWNHPTVGSDGLTVYGFIRQINDKCRWHAILNDEGIIIHQDMTVNGHHRLNWRMGIEKQERMRLCRIYNELFPKDERQVDSMTMKIKKKGEFAPNLIELQRNHKTPLLSHDTQPLLNN